MDGKIVIKSISISGLLSFGYPGVEIKLSPLNVLIGPNGSGKSNFVEVFRLLQSLPGGKSDLMTEGGGVASWFWKGANERLVPLCSVKVGVTTGPFTIEHRFTLSSGFPEIPYVTNVYFVDEVLEVTKSSFDDYTGVFYDYNGRNPKIRQRLLSENEDKNNKLQFTTQTLEPSIIKGTQSILSQVKGRFSFFEISLVESEYEAIKYYGVVGLGQNMAARRPQDAGLDSTYLFEDASNLALVLNDLQNQPQAKRNIVERLRQFYPRVEDIITRVQGGTVQIFFQEEGLTQTVPATRLSDGTLRYLCLLVLLCHPTPPPVMCIEEPELGMHPDVLPVIAELLIEASQRSQLIVTTHSDLLVSAIGEKHPEAIVVCERTAKGTTMNRLNPESLTEWLKDYSLGEVWLRGGIGGVRS